MDEADFEAEENMGFMEREEEAEIPEAEEDASSRRAELRERLEGDLARIRETLDEETVPMPFRAYFLRVAEFILSVTTYAENRSLYADILPDHYARSWANPDYASERLGEEYGPLLSSVYVELRGIIPAVFEGNDEDRAILCELFLELYFEFENEDLPSPETVKAIYSSYLRDYMPKYVRDRIRKAVDPAESFERDILEYADLSAPWYLFSYGEYISPEMLERAEHTAALSDEETEREARLLAEQFLEGMRRPHSGEIETARIVYEPGTERVIREAVRMLRNAGIEPTILSRPSHLAAKDMGRNDLSIFPAVNPQMEEDHREDLALVLDSSYVSARKRAQQEAFEDVKDPARRHAGCAILFSEETAAKARAESEDAAGAKARRGHGDASAAKVREEHADMHPAEHAIRMTKEQRELAHSLSEALAEIAGRYTDSKIKAGL